MTPTTYGSNYTKTGKREAWNKIKRLLGRRSMSTRPSILGDVPPILTKAGAPANNTAGDDPGALYTWIYDSTDKRVYVCTAYTNSTTFTVTRIA